MEQYRVIGIVERKGNQAPGALPRQVAIYHLSERNDLSELPDRVHNRFQQTHRNMKLASLLIFAYQTVVANDASREELPRNPQLPNRTNHISLWIIWRANSAGPDRSQTAQEMVKAYRFSNRSLPVLARPDAPTLQK